MKHLTLLFSFCILIMLSCNKQESLISQDDFNEDLTTGLSNGIIHHVSIGSNDACASFGLEPGCDKSFSLTANMRADGSVKGQWQDKFSDRNGVHVDIDCMYVDGNAAVVGGYVKKGSFNGVDIAGFYAVTAMVDNGTSSKDPLDQISFSYAGVNPDFGCYYNISAFDFLDLEKGQVKVK